LYITHIVIVPIGNCIYLVPTIIYYRYGKTNNAVLKSYLKKKLCNLRLT
jgi:hypothetical protein